MLPREASVVRVWWEVDKAWHVGVVHVAVAGAGAFHSLRASGGLARRCTARDDAHVRAQVSSS